MKNQFKLTEHTSPADVFIYQENLRSEREWANKNEIIPIPKYKKCEGIKANAGWWVFYRDILKEFRP